MKHHASTFQTCQGDEKQWCRIHHERGKQGDMTTVRNVRYWSGFPKRKKDFGGNPNNIWSLIKLHIIGTFLGFTQIPQLEKRIISGETEVGYESYRKSPNYFL